MNALGGNLFRAAASPGHKAQADREVRPREMRRPTSHRALDALLAVPGQRQHLEPREPDPGEDVRGLRSARALGQIRPQEELGDHGLGRHADQGLQLQYTGEGALVRGAQRLRQVHRCASHAAVHSHQQRFVLDSDNFLLGFLRVVRFVDWARSGRL